VPSEAHSCVRRAIELLGLGSESIRPVPLSGGRLDPNALRAAIAADRAAGGAAALLVGSAGTVNTGAIDPLEDLADVAAAEGLWFHVDGAYGAFGVLDPAIAARYRGMERADSLTLDPYKWLGVPVDAGCALVRRADELREAFSTVPPYLRQDAGAEVGTFAESDPIDALNVARAALQEGLESFPVAHLDGPELDVRLLVDHRERLVRHRVELNSTLQWHLHDLWPELQLPGGALFSKKWSTRIGRRLARAEQTMRVRIARDELRRLRELTVAINQLEREITELIEQIAPQLLDQPGFGPLIAAKLVGEIAGAHRFATPAKLARAAGVAPIPASSGNTQRQRLDQGGNRQINAALHRVIVTRARCHPQTRDYIARRRSEGKTTREAIRCLKRYLVRRVWHLLRAAGPVPDHAINTSIS
jgi:transposase